MSRSTAVVVGALLVAATTPVTAQAPDRVVVSVAAPVFSKPDAAIPPLRVAKEGSVLKVVATDRDWYQVEFEDPQLGRRVGYIQRRHVRVLPPDSNQPQVPVDLTVAEARPRPVAPAVQIQPATVPRPSPSYSFYPAAETAVGWGILRDSSLDQTSILGWNVSFAGNLTPWLGVVGDVSGNYKTLNEALGLKLRIHTFLSGVRVTGRFSDGRVNPFGQFLAGIAQSSGTFLGSSLGSSTDFAIQPGGGVDIGLSDAIAVRLQVDFRTVFSEPERFSEFRFLPGLVVRTGSKAF